MSLANNDFRDLRQLEKLALALPNLRALDLSDNPIGRYTELDTLLAQGEKKGKATAGTGGLKSLIELKLNGCTFREEILKKPKGDDIYKQCVAEVYFLGCVLRCSCPNSEILRRFPGLLILDGVNLDRIVFPIHRKPVIRRSEEERKAMQKKPFSFPADAQPGYLEQESVKDFVMRFCFK